MAAPLRFPEGQPRLVGTIVTPRGLLKITRAAACADLAEIRVDALLEAGLALEEIERLLRRRKLPALLTCRIPAEGGRRAWKRDERIAAFEFLLPAADAIDVELASAVELKPVLSAARRQQKQVILSAHSIDKPVPAATLHRWVAAFHRAKPDVAKIAARIGNQDDLRALAALLLERPSRQRWAVMGLGRHGALSRHIFSALGSALLYGYLDEPAADGQPSAFALDRFRAELPR